MNKSNSASEYWDKIFSKENYHSYGIVDKSNIPYPIIKRALEHFESIEGKTVIDLGCGNGAASLIFAELGANVISIDLSENAINNLSNYCKEKGIDNIKAIKLSALEIDQLEGVDFIFGSMILHHIEPFKDFALKLKDTLADGAKGFFWENNARSNLIIWFRQNIVGKLWVPKYGDYDEFPLTPSEVDELREYFNIKIEYPELFYFRLISIYLLRGKFSSLFKLIDDKLYKYPYIRKYSYRQYVLLG